MRRLLALVTLSALGLTTGLDAGLAEEKSELDKACWPHMWSADVVAAKLAECQRFADSLPENDPLRIGAVDRQVSMLVSQGRWDEAMPLVNAFLEKHPDATDIRLRRIELLGTGDARLKFEDLEFLREHAPDDPRVWAEYGQFQMMVGSHADAVQSFNRGLSLDPKSLDLLQRRAYAYRHLGRTQEALADVNLLIEIEPKEWRALLMRAELELANGHPERTIADIETLRSFGPFGGDETSLILAQAQIMSDQPQEALAALDAALASYPTKGDPELQQKALLWRLGVMEKLGDKAGADETLTRWLQVTDQGRILRMQVFLKNMGWNDVSISGTVDGATRAALAGCLFRQACNGPFQNI